MNNQILEKRLGLSTAIFVVIASMIGTGIFGNTGFIQQMVGNPAAVLFLWFLGGIIALSGALCYAELAVMMPHAGGEYLYLRKTFGKLISFLTGWVSFIVGFSAPVASAALLSADYGSQFLKATGINIFGDQVLDSTVFQKGYAIILLSIFTAVHLFSQTKGSIVQNILVFLKVAILTLFAVAGIAVWISSGDDGSIFTTRFTNGPTLRFEGLGTGLLFVMFAYSGWNGATYLGEEIKEPNKNLPRALVRGTLITTGLYLGLNLLYYLAIPPEQMEGQSAVAALAAINTFGPKLSAVFDLIFSAMLFTTISVMIMVGPRVYLAMARDGLFFKKARKINPKTGTPVYSILFQSALSLMYILTGEYETIVTYMGFALSIFPVLTVVAMMILRRREKNERHYRTPFYPLVPVFFIVFSIIIMVMAYMGRPVESTFAIIAVLSGIPVFYIWKKFYPEPGE